MRESIMRNIYYLYLLYVNRFKHCAGRYTKCTYTCTFFFTERGDSREFFLIASNIRLFAKSNGWMIPRQKECV